MVIPQWIALLVAAMVLLFGVYRLSLSRRSDAEQERAAQRRGLFGMPRSRHLMFGILYVVMGVFLLLSALGVRLNPF
jgi:Na+/H+ antiporter NhaD/arsenite permease-like protein